MYRYRILLGAAVALAMVGSQADAGLLFNRKAADPQPEVLAPIPATAYYTMGGQSCCQPLPLCCPTSCITYRHRGIKVKCCGCPAPQSTMLVAVNPCTGCPVNVPVCLPGCCDGQPCVSCRPALLGDGVVTYEWCCGVSVTVRFKKCGDVAVTYWRA